MTGSGGECLEGKKEEDCGERKGNEEERNQ